MSVVIETDRLSLREWRWADRAAFQTMCRSPAVMEYLGGPADVETIDDGIASIRACQADHGHCFWAVERRGDGAFLGFCGLKIAIGTEAAIEGDVEIGWRLREDAWGHGYASEAARASMAWAWANLSASRVVAITVRGNRRSRAVMERLGMTRCVDLDFPHPLFDADHPLSPHVTYVAERPLHD